MKRWLITLALLAAAFALLFEVLGIVCPWVTPRQRVYILFLTTGAWCTFRAAWTAGEMSA